MFVNPLNKRTIHVDHEHSPSHAASQMSCFLMGYLKVPNVPLLESMDRRRNGDKALEWIYFQLNIRISCYKDLQL